MEVKQTNDLPDHDPRHHALNLCSAIRDLAAHAREDVLKVEERSGRVLLEATAETLLGLANGLEALRKAIRGGNALIARAPGLGRVIKVRRDPAHTKPASTASLMASALLGVSIRRSGPVPRLEPDCRSIKVSALMAAR